MSPPVVNTIGFDLENTYFYVHTSNVENVMKLSSTERTAALQIYPSCNVQSTFNVQVSDTGIGTDPVFSIGRPNAPVLYIRNSNVGINNADPYFNLDIKGNIRIDGNIVQTSNVILTTDLISTGNVFSIDPRGINFTNTALYNIKSLQVNQNTTFNSSQTQAVNGTQSVQFLKATDQKNTAGAHTHFCNVSWNRSLAISVFEPVFETHISFHASGSNGTRLHLKGSMFINVQTGTLDVVTDKTTFFSDNVNYVDIHVATITQSSVNIGVTWALASPVTHVGHMKIEVLAPSALGSITIA